MDLGEVLEGASVVIEGNVITAVTDDPHGGHRSRPGDRPARAHPRARASWTWRSTSSSAGRAPRLNDPVRMDPVKMGLRAVANGQRTLARRASRRCGTSGCSSRPAATSSTSPSPTPSTPAGSQGPRVIPAGHAICPTGGHLDPSAQSGLAPGIMRMTVEEGIADGVERGPQGGPLPDHPRRPAHQVLRVRRRDDPDRPPGGAAVLRPRSSPRSPTRPTAAACGSPPTRTATRR